MRQAFQQYFCIGLAALLVGVGAVAQQTVPAPPTPNPAVGANLPALPLGANDLVRVQVYGAPQLETTLRLSADGKLKLPFLTEAIPAQGLLPEQLQALVAQSMRHESVMVDPVVQVIVQEYRSHPVAVMGAVQHPLVLQAYPGMKLLDALAGAGGLTADAGPEVVVSRDGNPTLQVNVHELMQGLTPASNLPLQGGEQVRVPEMMTIYVVGNVMKPGLVRIDEPGDATVLTAIAVAGGMKDFTGKQAFIYRVEPNASIRKEITVPLAEILDRKAADPLLQPNDVVLVPDSTRKRFGSRALEIMGTAGATAIGAYAVYH